MGLKPFNYNIALNIFRRFNVSYVSYTFHYKERLNRIKRVTLPEDWSFTCPKGRSRSASEHKAKKDPKQVLIAEETWIREFLLSAAFSLIYHRAILPQARFLVLTALNYDHCGILSH